MRRAGIIVVTLAVALITAAPSAHAFVVGRHSWHHALAIFSSFDESGCVETQAVVGLAYLTIQYPPGPPTTSTADVSLSVWGYDHCAERLLGSGGVSNPTLPSDAFQIRPDLSAATFDATVELCDGYGANCTYPVSFALTWRATGPVMVERDRGHYADPPEWVTNGHDHALVRSAEVSGVISDGTVNYSPNPTPHGWLASQDQMDIFAGKP